MNCERHNQNLNADIFLDRTGSLCLLLRLSFIAGFGGDDNHSAAYSTVMRKATITISIDEYEHLLQMEDLTHRQRFTIRNLEKKLERHKVDASVFAWKTLQILLGTGYSMFEIHLLYSAIKTKEGKCQGN